MPRRSCRLADAVKRANSFPDPEYYRGAYDDYQPVGEQQRRHVEELPAKFNDQYLTDEDYRGYQQETAAALEMERRATCGECAGVEHVPELEEHEDGEEERQLVGRHARVGANCQAANLGERRQRRAVEIVEQAYQHREKCQSRADDRAPHSPVCRSPPPPTAENGPPISSGFPCAYLLNNSSEQSHQIIP